MDVAKWLDDMQELYNPLCDLDTDCMSDREFAFAILDLMLSDSDWQPFLSTLCTMIHDCDKQRVDINSTSFITRIWDEHWHHHKDNYCNDSHVFSAWSDAQRQNHIQKCFRGSAEMSMVSVPASPATNACAFLILLTPTNYTRTTTVVPFVDMTLLTASHTKVQRRVNIKMVGVALGTFIFHLHSELQKTTPQLNHTPLTLIYLCWPLTTTNQLTTLQSNLPLHRSRLLTILTPFPLPSLPTLPLMSGLHTSPIRTFMPLCPSSTFSWHLTIPVTMTQVPIATSLMTVALFTLMTPLHHSLPKDLGTIFPLLLLDKELSILRHIMVAACLPSRFTMCYTSPLLALTSLAASYSTKPA